MVESFAEDFYAPVKIKPGKTRNEGVAIYVHESLSFEIKVFDTEYDLIYLAISCTNSKKEKITLVCFYNPRLVNQQYFLVHSGVGAIFSLNHLRMVKGI